MQLQDRVELARLGDAKAHGLRGLRVASTGSEDSRESRIVVRRGEEASDGAHQADSKNITFQNESNYEISVANDGTWTERRVIHFGTLRRSLIRLLLNFRIFVLRIVIKL